MKYSTFIYSLDYVSTVEPYYSFWPSMYLAGCELCTSSMGLSLFKIF